MYQMLGIWPRPAEVARVSAQPAGVAAGSDRAGCESAADRSVTGTAGVCQRFGEGLDFF